MNDQLKKLYKYFQEKALHLQKEIDWEVERIGGEDMLISREDLIHWVYHAREEVQTYYIICQMLEDKADGADTAEILRELRATVESDCSAIESLLRKQEEERKALEQLREESEYYREALEVLGRKE